MDQYTPFVKFDDTAEEIDVEEAFGEHDIAYWVREGNRLVPATPQQIATIQEHEAHLRFTIWRTHFSVRPLQASRPRHIVQLVRQWFSRPLAHHQQPDTPNTPDTAATIATHLDTSITQTQQQAARERLL